MRISSFQIIILTGVFSLIGLILLPTLPLKLNPSPSQPNLNITFYWPHSSPINIEHKATSILESGYSQIRGVSKITSKSSQGTGIITLEFDKYTSLDKARFEVATMTRQLARQLPEMVSYPQIKINTNNIENQKPFLSYSINAPASPHQIRQTIINEIKPSIVNVKGLDHTAIFGATPLEWVISYDNNLLQQLSITRKDINEGITSFFNQVNVGEIKNDKRAISVSLLPNTEDHSWRIPIKKVGSRIVYLNEIASIRQDTQEPSSYYRVNGSNSLTLALFAKKGQNQIDLANRLEKTIKKTTLTLPNGYEVTKIYDKTQYIKKELKTIFIRSVCTILILLLFIFFTTFSFSYLLLVVLSLMVNLLIAISVYSLFNIEIQLYSLAGITISMGLIIDNSIVMIDHFKKYKNKKVFLSLLAATCTSIGALSAIYFLTTEYRYNLKDFAGVIIINLFISLFTSLFFIPALIDKIKFKGNQRSYFLNSPRKTINFYRLTIVQLLRYKIFKISFLILLFGLPVFLLPQRLDSSQHFWQKMYNKTLGGDFYLENIQPHVNVYLGGTLRLFSFYVLKNTYYEDNNETILNLSASLPKGATVHQLNGVFLQIEDYLKRFPQIKQYQISIGSENYGTAEITFHEKFSSGSFPHILKANLIRKTMDIGGVEWKVTGLGKGYSNNIGSVNEPVTYQVKAYGYNYNELNRWIFKLEQELLENSRVRNVVIRGNNQYAPKKGSRYILALDPEQLSALNLNPAQVYEDLKSVTLSKRKDLSLVLNNELTTIRLESKASIFFDLWSILNFELQNGNRVYKLKQVARVNKELEEENIYKENQEYIRTLEFEYTGADKFGQEFLSNQILKINELTPLGFRFEQSEANRRITKKEKWRYIILLITIILIIYIICAVLLESLTKPFVILSVVPISFIGVFLTFYVGEFPFNQGGMASFVLLSGITVNSSIYIINEFNQLQKQFRKKNKLDVYLMAVQNKIYPILLTIFSTIAGFIPFVINGEENSFWFALGIGTIGGLIFSLVAILIYLPMLALSRKNIGV